MEKLLKMCGCQRRWKGEANVDEHRVGRERHLCIKALVQSRSWSRSRGATTSFARLWHSSTDSPPPPRREPLWFCFKGVFNYEFASRRSSTSLARESGTKRGTKGEWWTSEEVPAPSRGGVDPAPGSKIKLGSPSSFDVNCTVHYLCCEYTFPTATRTNAPNIFDISTVCI